MDTCTAALVAARAGTLRPLPGIPSRPGRTRKQQCRSAAHFCAQCASRQRQSRGRGIGGDVKAEQDALTGLYCSGVSYVDGSRVNRYPSAFAECTECHSNQSLTTTGRVRKHFSHGDKRHSQLISTNAQDVADYERDRYRCCSEDGVADSSQHARMYDRVTTCPVDQPEPLSPRGTL